MRGVRALALTAITVAAAGIGFGAAPASAATSVGLVLPQATAFSILGRSCGGIQQQDVASGFTGTAFYPTGNVYIQTRCGGSGRGGGYHTTTYSAWVSVVWSATGAVQSATRLSAAPTSLDPTLSVTDPRGDRVYNTLTATNVAPANCAPGTTTYCSYRAYYAPAPPVQVSGVAVSEVGTALVVTWTPPATGGAPTAITVSATPTAGGAVLSGTSAGTATTATLANAAAGTQYSVIVTAANAAGTAPSSVPVLFTTTTASIPPGAPGGLKVSWHGGTVLSASWTAGSTGNSPIDGYQVQVAQSDPNGPPTTTSVGLVTSVALPAYNSSLDWSVQVRAHNGAGWGPWTAKVILPAGN